MVSLARSTLLYEWKRYLAAVLAVAFSGLLLLVQLGLLLGMFGTVTTVVDRAKADLWVVSHNTESFDLAREMPSRYEMRIRMHPQVETVQELIYGWGDWRAQDGSKVSVYIIGLDVSTNSLSLPADFSDDMRQRLFEPGGVLIDQADVKKLKTEAGQTAEINSKRVKVVGTTRGYRAIGGAYIFCSLTTARELLGEALNSDLSQYFLIKLRVPANTEAVRDELQPHGSSPPYAVYRPAGLSMLSQRYWLLESGSGAAFGFSAFLGLLVGIAITSQTLRAATLSQIREYATLRALGVSVRSLRNVVLEQAFWIGIVGFGVTAAITAFVAITAHFNYIAIKFPWWAIVGTAIITMTVAVLSGAMALKPLYRSEPADLLR